MATLLMCIQCAAKAMVEHKPYYGEPDKTLFEHMMRCHADPVKTAEERRKLIEEAGKCECRTPGCGHLASQHGPGGVCEICKVACWS